MQNICQREYCQQVKFERQLQGIWLYLLCWWAQKAFVGHNDLKSAGQLLLSLLWAAHFWCQPCAPVCTQIHIFLLCCLTFSQPWPSLTFSLPLKCSHISPTSNYLFWATYYISAGNINVYLCCIYILKSVSGFYTLIQYVNLASFSEAPFGPHLSYYLL